VADPRSILIVDDEFGLAELLREMLHEYGYDVSLAINGRLALDILRERRIDLVLMDLMMPVMDGAELAAVMRNSEDHRRIPIVMMTSLPSAVPQQPGLYDALLRKPFTPEMLIEAMHGCLAEGNGTDGGATPDQRLRRV
jgi:CheY-like chemotaxis protein